MQDNLQRENTPFCTLHQTALLQEGKQLFIWRDGELQTGNIWAMTDIIDQELTSP